MATGKPAIGTPASADREWQLAINNIRERFQALEAQVAALQRISGKEDIAQSIRSLQQQLTQLAKQIIALGGEADTLLPDLLTHANGIVVLKDGRLITRAIQVTDSLTIDNPAGQDGNPIIHNSPAGSAVPGAGADGWDWGGEGGLEDMVE